MLNNPRRVHIGICLAAGPQEEEGGGEESEAGADTALPVSQSVSRSLESLARVGRGSGVSCYNRFPEVPVRPHCSSLGLGLGWGWGVVQLVCVCVIRWCPANLSRRAQPCTMIIMTNKRMLSVISVRQFAPLSKLNSWKVYFFISSFIIP